jgi:hypothetical protein
VRGAVVETGGREVVCWCSNDYLGFASHPALAEASAAAARQWGVGSRASRLLAGTTDVHVRLEEALAAWHRAEAAIVYSSGYLANLGALGALLSPRDAVFVDRLAHASLLDAARATRAAFRVFRHNDVSHLAALLSRAEGARRRFIVTEGLFSMDGDRAPLAELLDTADRFDAVLYLDDAHGAFVEGPNGRGSAEAAGVPETMQPLVRELSDGRGADLVMVTGGGTAALPWATRAVRDGGSLHYFAGGAGETLPLPLEVLYKRELTLTTTYSSSPADLAAAFALIAAGDVSTEPLVSHRLSLDRVEEGVALMRRQAALKVFVTP